MQQDSTETQQQRGSSLVQGERNDKNQITRVEHYDLKIGSRSEYGGVRSVTPALKSEKEELNEQHLMHTRSLVVQFEYCFLSFFFSISVIPRESR